MQTSTINPARYIPTAMTKSIVNEKYGIEVHYNEEQKIAIGYCGKSKKHNFYNRYTSADRMMTAIDTFVNNVINNADAKEKAKEKQKAAAAQLSATDHFNVGDIIVNSWGWEQTNIEFYTVTAVKGKTIEVAEVYSQQVEGSMYGHGMACNVTPSNVIKENGDTYKLRIKPGYNGGAAICQPESYYYMHKWDGRPMYQSWYA
jgi:hypothetical protein